MNLADNLVKIQFLVASHVLIHFAKKARKEIVAKKCPGISGLKSKKGLRTPEKH